MPGQSRDNAVRSRYKNVTQGENMREIERVGAQPQIWHATDLQP
jgi:hypothetical protein